MSLGVAFAAFRVVVMKEIVDNFRDRRALTTAFIMPLLGPFTLVALFFAISDAEHKTKAPHVPIVGAENAPELVHFLERQGVVVEAAPPDAEASVREAKVDVVLRIPADFGSHLRAGTGAIVEVVCDPSRQNGAPTLKRVEGLLEGYGRQIGALRLVLRGVDPSILQAVRVERTDVSAPGAEKALLLGSLPLFILMSCFACGLYVAIDVTAGERERGSLEPLLLNPVAPTTLVLAKTATTLLFSLLGVTVGVAAFGIVVPSLPFADIGLDVHLAPRVIALYALLFMPTAMLAAAVQIFVGTLSKNTKTAQASLGLILIGPVLPGIIVTMFPQQPSVALCAVPALGESILAMRLLRGEDVQVIHWLANSGSDLVIAAVLVVVSARLFGPRMLSS